MASRQPSKTSFEATKVIRPIFTGGSVALDNDARMLATTLGEDALLTDPANGQHLAKIEGDGEQISALALTPSGSHLILCSRSLSMRIFTLKRSADDTTIEPTLVRSLKPHATPIVVLAVDRTSTLVATGCADGTIKVWDIAGGYVTHTFRGPSGLVTALRFYEVMGRAPPAHKKKRKPGNEGIDVEAEIGETGETTLFRLVSGSQDGKVRVWDLNRRSCIANLDSHVSDVQAVDYSPREHVLVTAGRDKTIIWWDAKTWKARRVVPCLETVEAAGFVDDGRLTYSAGANGHLRIWDSETGREFTKERAPKGEGEAIVSALYRPQLPFLLCVQVDHTLALYRVPTKADASQLSITEPFRRISGTHDEIIDLAYVLPDHSLLALATNSEDIRLVSVVEPQTAIRNLSWTDDSQYFGRDVGLLQGHEDIVITIDVDWSGHWIATGAKDNTAKVWRVDPTNGSFACWATFSGHAESLGAVALPRSRPAETSAAFSDPLSHPPPFLITGSQDKTIKKWEIPRQAQPQAKSGSRATFTRKAHDKDINAVEVHPSSRLFASSSQDKTVKIWSVEEGEVQGILKGHRRGVWSISFAPLGLPAIQGDEGSVAGKGVILTGSGDKTVKLWSLSNYSCIRTFEGHANSVLKVAWLNPQTDDKAKKQTLVLSAGGDGLVKVWDVNSGEAECTLDNHEDRVWALAVQPKTNMIVSGSGDSTVTFWKDTTAETQAAASAAALQLVEQEQELENYMHAGSYREAIALALQLNHPGRLLSLFTAVVTTKTPEQGSLSGVKAVDNVLGNLSDEQIFLLLLRLRDWNTNARAAPIAQRILWVLVKSYPASRFSNLSVKGARGQKNLKEVLDGLKAYTERHYKRVEELVDESYLVEYTLQEMDSLAPALEDVAMGESVEGQPDVIVAV